MGTVLRMEQPVKIAVVGSINMDLVIRAAHLPVPGETVLGEGYQTFFGGKGANQAVAAAKLGAHTRMIGAVGSDTFADELIENLQSYQIDTEFVTHKQDTASGIALIGIDDVSGENFIIVAGGANRTLHPTNLMIAADAIRSADVLVCQLEIPLDAVQMALQIAKDHQVTTVLNAAPICDLPDELLRLVDHLVINETEAMQLSGIAIHELEDVEQASAVLLGKGISCVAITMGAKGAYAIDHNQRVYLPAFPIKVVDTVGAGDAFVAAYALAAAQGKTIADTLKFANAVGALATTRLGAQSGSPSDEEVKAFLTRFRNKDFI